MPVPHIRKWDMDLLSSFFFTEGSVFTACIGVRSFDGIRGDE